MKAKMLVIALVLAGSVFAAACDKPGYTCEGAGTCEEARACVNQNTFDYYWIVDGRNFYDAYDVAEYCNTSDYNDYNDYNDGYTCEGLGTCDDPLVCCVGSDCYYEADGETFWCDYQDCGDAAQDMAYHCWS